MSDSDSESDFESADEDTEQDTDSRLSSQSDNVKIADEKRDVKSSEKKSSQVAEASKVDLDHHNTDDDLISKLTVSEPDNRTDISHSNTEKKAKNVFERTQSDPVKPEELETKRVTLLREKKLQEKSRAHSLEQEANLNTQAPEKSSSWGFSTWGTSFLSSAASSVSTFTSQVSQGIGTVLETVETTLGAPPPETLAETLSKKREFKEGANSETDAEQKDSESQKTNSNSTIGADLYTGVASITKAIESTGTKVIMGGLDTLELIGKKTIDILTEGDPGLRKKRSVFSEGVTLSQILREAKAKTEEVDELETNQEDTIHYSRCFDDSQGLVHLEALEMLSSQNQGKVQGALMMLSPDSEKMTKLNQVKCICENLPSPDDIPDEETEQNFEEAFSEHTKALRLQVGVEKILEVYTNTRNWLSDCKAEQEKGERKNPKDIYHQAIKCLAEFTARSVEQFHKVAELILVQKNADAVEYSIHLTGLTTVLCIEIGIVASKFCQCLNTAADDSEDPDSVNPLITSVYLEASNSTTYMQDAFQLLVPILQSTLLIQE